MTSIFSSGWENSGGSDVTDDDAWLTSSGEITVSTTEKNSGTYAAKILLSAGTSGWVIKTISAAGDVYLRAYVYIDSASSDTAHQYLRLGSSTGDVSFGAYTSDGSSWVLYIDGDGLWDMWGSVTPNAYHCFELRRSSTSGIVQAWLDDTLVVDESGLTVSGATTDAYVGIIYANKASGTVYVDDVEVADSKIGLLSTEPFYPFVQQLSDVDSVADVGTHSTFANQQADDANYDTLTEADTDAGTSTVGKTSGSGTSYRTVAADEFRGAVVSIASGASGELQSIVFYGRGASTVNVKGVVYDDSGTLLATGDVVSVNTTTGTKTLTFTNKPMLAAGTYWIGLIPAANLRLYYESTTGGTNKRDTSNSYTTPTDADDASDTTETWRILYANITEYNYQLSLEEQFTEVPYTTISNPELHVTAGTFSSPTETLNVQVWDVDEWVTLGVVTASQDNVYDITDYVTSANLYIRFVDGTASNDVVQSTWQIGALFIDEADAPTLIEVTDTLAASDALTRNGMFIISDVIGLASNSGFFDPTFFDPTFFDTGIAGELIVVTLNNALKEVTDTLTVTDILLRHKPLLPISDVAALVDFIYKTRSLTITDAATLTDVLLTNKICTVTDVGNIVDALLTHKILPLTDTTTLIDSVLKHAFLNITDTINAVDAIIFGTIIKSITDVIGVSEILYRDKTLPVTDVLSLVEALKTDKNLQVIDGIETVDLTLTHKNLNVTDDVTAQETIMANKLLLMFETLNLADLALLNRFVRIVDACVTTEEVNKIIIPIINIVVQGNAGYKRYRFRIRGLKP